MARRTPGMRRTPGVRGGAGIRTPNVRGGGMRKARTKIQSPTGPSSRGAQVMKAAAIAQGGKARAPSLGVRSVGRGGVVTKDTTTAAAFRARAPVDKTEPARMAAARAAGMRLPTSRPVGSRPVGSVGLPIATSRPVGRRKVTRVPTRNTSRGSSRR
jgi:hypothetical protein